MAVTLSGIAGTRTAFASRLVEETWKYLLVSALALSVDYGLLVGLTEVAGIHYLVSAAIGFCAGSVVSYVLSVAFVFRSRRLADRRRAEFMGYFVIGIFGLGFNEVAMKLAVDMLGVGYILAKVPAAALGFVLNFGARRALLFTEKKD